MDVYTLKFPDEGNAGALRLDFDAEDAADALVLAHREVDEVRRGRTAELWQGARRLCAIRRASQDLAAGISPGRFQTA